MDTDALRQLGLTENDIKVYLAALELKQASATQIAKTAKVHRSKAYESLQRLIDKGVVHYEVKDYKKIFVTNRPEALRELIEEQEKTVQQARTAVEQMLPQLQLLYGTHTEEQRANVYEGIPGIKVFHHQVLQAGTEKDTINIMGVPLVASAVMEGFLMEFHQLRIEKGIPARVLYEYAARDNVTKRNALPKTKARYLDESIRSPAVTFLFRNTVGLIIFSPSPVCFEIRSELIAQSFQSYFEYMWERAKKS